MKILFSVYHPGFIRHFERALGILCDEGHSVHIAFHNEKVSVQEWTRELREANPQITISVKAPRRSDEWTDLARRIRTMRDYLMYFNSRYATAHRLRANAARELERGDRERVGRWVRIPGIWRALNYLLSLVERALPGDPQVDAFVAQHAPDVLLITPLVIFNPPQVEYIKAARKLGIPSALLVASWDNLTNKGQMRDLPDRVIVWNEAQAEEAVTLHGMPRRRVVVTGAQSFDHWFESQPSRSREAFLRERGLDPDTDLILYLCSSTSISPNEIEFVREWHDAVRKSPDPRVARAAILVRPHPMNKQPWEQLDALANFCVWPRNTLDSFNPQGRRDYFDSMYHAAAVVGLNTSGQVEAGIVGKPVLTLLSKDIPHTLYGTTDTIHFQHLLTFSGGLLHVAGSFDEHLEHLAKAIAGDPAMTARSRRFTEAFIRPHGISRPAAPLLADAMRALFAVKPRRPILDRIFLQPILRPLLRRSFIERRQARTRESRPTA